MTAAWWRQLAWRRIGWLAGSVLLLLGAALYRHPLEASMAWNTALSRTVMPSGACAEARART